MRARGTSIIPKRRLAICELIRDNPLPVEEIVEQLRPQAAKRSVYEDITWLQETFPSQCLRERAAGQHGKYRVTYRWQGGLPHLLAEPIAWLTEDELIGLVAARGLFQDGSDQQQHDLLAGAVSRLIDRAGIQDAAEILARRILTVSRFGAQSPDPAVLAHCLQACAAGRSFRFRYRNLAGNERQIHACPQRCVLIKGEWYVIAWAGGLKNFRMCRIADPQSTPERPADAPGHIPASEVDALLADGFFATYGQRPARVVLAVSPQAWPHLEGRRWGDKQRVDEAPKDLPDGWRRLSFTTTGLAECQHWVLAFGANVRAEKPKALVDWVCEQARAMLDGCGGR